MKKPNIKYEELKIFKKYLKYIEWYLNNYEDNCINLIEKHFDNLQSILYDFEDNINKEVNKK